MPIKLQQSKQNDSKNSYLKPNEDESLHSNQSPSSYPSKDELQSFNSHEFLNSKSKTKKGNFH